MQYLYILDEGEIHPYAEHIRYIKNDSGCFICVTHKRDRDNYPRFMRNGIDWIMSRYIYTIFKGEIQKGKVVRHTCHNPECINPEHLIIGTQKDNMNDSKLRKRQIKKLPREAVRKIRDAEEKTIQELAAEFGRTGSSIYKILKKISYSNIN